MASLLHNDFTTEADLTTPKGDPETTFFEKVFETVRHRTCANLPSLPSRLWLNFREPRAHKQKLRNAFKKIGFSTY
ncbi:MAG: hypothetical protein AAGJ70_08215 [Pseudomonadota bacterium]